MKMKGLSDSLLCKLWRQAVLKRWGNKCAFCGNTNVNKIECHHIIYRRHKVLKYDISNGIPLCKYSCHLEAHSKLGEARIQDLLGEPAWIRLCNLERKTIKDYLRETGMTKNEWLTETKNKLLEEMK
jgi:predicted restriction endonuclease